MKLLSIILMFAILAQFSYCEGIPCPPLGEDNGVGPGDIQWCKMPGIYGRGAGYPWKFGDGLNLDGAKKRCEKDNPDLGCETWGAVVYPKCKEGYKNQACCICAISCPSGWETTVRETYYCTKELKKQ